MLGVLVHVFAGVAQGFLSWAPLPKVVRLYLLVFFRLLPTYGTFFAAGASKHSDYFDAYVFGTREISLLSDACIEGSTSCQRAKELRS